MKVRYNGSFWQVFEKDRVIGRVLKVGNRHTFRPEKTFFPEKKGLYSACSKLKKIKRLIDLLDQTDR